METDHLLLAENSRSIGPSSVASANYSVLICCTCQFQSCSLLLVYFGFFCLQVSSVSNFSPDTWGKGGHLFRLACSIVLWRGRNTQTYHWCVGGVLTVSRPHWVCPLLTLCVLSQSTLLRLQAALQGNCLKWALGCVHLPGLSQSCSGS